MCHVDVFVAGILHYVCRYIIYAHRPSRFISGYLFGLGNLVLCSPKIVMEVIVDEGRYWILLLFADLKGKLSSFDAP